MQKRPKGMRPKAMKPKNPESGGGKSGGMTPVRSLSRLLEGLTYTVLSAADPSQVLVSSMTGDSRKAGESSLFVALTGTKTDGHHYCVQAAAQGCAAILIEEGKIDPALLAGSAACIIAVKDSRRAYAGLAANFFEHPARNMRFIGITGTNGKTTITYLLEHILEQAGLAVGVIGTVNYRYSTANGKVEAAAPFTTPEPLLLQGLLRTMADAGVQYVLMEASSHALLQHRLGDIRFDVAAFTNLSRDHLDYHADMEAYYLAKTRLFTDYLKDEGKAELPAVKPKRSGRSGSLSSAQAGRLKQFWSARRCVLKSDLSGPTADVMERRSCWRPARASCVWNLLWSGRLTVRIS